MGRPRKDAVQIDDVKKARSQERADSSGPKPKVVSLRAAKESADIKRHNPLPLVELDNVQVNIRSPIPVQFGQGVSEENENGRTRADRLSKIALHQHNTLRPHWNYAESLMPEMPKVLNNVIISARSDPKIITREQAAPYLPANITIDIDVGPKMDTTFKQINASQSIRLDEFLDDAYGYILNTGCCVRGIAWANIEFQDSDYDDQVPAEFFAITGSKSAQDDQAMEIDAKCSLEAKGFIQIWSIVHDTDSLNQGKGQTRKKRSEMETDGQDTAQKGHLALVQTLCVNGGNGGHCQFISSVSSQSTSLGLLAVLFEDGAVHIFDVPRPTKDQATNTFVKLQPIMHLSLPDTNINCFHASSTMLVCGCTNGFIAAWSLEAIFKGNNSVQHYFPAHDSVISQITLIPAPSFDTKGEYKPNVVDHLVCSTGYDGSQILSNLQLNSACETLNQNRFVSMIAGYSPITGMVLSADADFSVSATTIRPGVLGKSAQQILVGRGHVTAVSASNYHAFVAAGFRDGSVQTTNILQALDRKKYNGQTQSVIYRLKYDPNVDVYRMLDYVETVEYQDLIDLKAERSYQWPANSAINCVCWATGGPRNAGILLSGTGGGLVRIDYLDAPHEQKLKARSTSKGASEQMEGSTSEDIDDDKED